MFITDDLLRPSRNNLTLARLILASAVIYSHSFFPDSENDGLTWLLGAAVSNFAVDGFFVLSGFLVYRSLSRKPSIKDFLIARLVRLWPALAAMIIVTTAAGALVTHSSLTRYLGGSDTLHYVIGNGSLLSGHYWLTGVQCGAERCNINGSLWTLPWEAKCYAALAILAGLGMVNRNAMLRLVLPATFLFALAADIPAVGSAVSHALGDGVWFNIRKIDRLWTCFALGIFAYEMRHRIPLSGRYLAALVVLDIVSWRLLPDAAVHVRAVLAGYLALYIGFRMPAISANWPDYSYGMYIYAFPAMTALLSIYRFPPYLLAVLVFCLTLPLAAASWHLVEKPTLDRLRRTRHGPTSTNVSRSGASALETVNG